VRLSVSNLAWSREHDREIARLLRALDMDAIDVAPGRYFADPAAVAHGEADAVRAFWADSGVEIVGLQALFFGTEGLNLFGPEAVQRRMLEHLRAVCRLGARLGARCLVFGSPRNRDAGDLGPEAALERSLSFFDRLGAIAEDAGVAVCLEPNPARYGCNFMVTTEAAAAVVRAVGRPGIRLQFDTGTWTANGEDAASAARLHAPLVGHVHVSEPGLAPVGTGGADHYVYAALLREWLPAHVVTIEMLPGADQVEAVRQAVTTAQAVYGRGARP